MIGITDKDQYLFNEGTHFELWKKLGAHPTRRDGEPGTHFAVWAPAASEVSVVGDFNGRGNEGAPMLPSSSGIWTTFVPGVGKGDAYRYAIVAGDEKTRLEKADPFAFHAETPPKTSSIVWQDDYAWSDDDWMQRRASVQRADAPMSIYELHPGSWRRTEAGEWLDWRELAEQLADYVEELGFTHVELLPVMEHPFYGSWGYQTTGYFAPTSRYGTPDDFKFFVDYLHGRGIGVLLDWVPSHFPNDPHGLATFDGTHLYEHADPRKGFHPDWKSAIFNYGRHEVRSFLVSSALFWLDEYHVDGLRVDAVASMLYLDYSREDGEWIPNEYGGRENLQAVSLLQQLNSEVYRRFPGAQTVAEESTSWPMVSRPTYAGGLGFGMKWDMGWMHDTLQYLAHDPVHRKYHHDEVTFRAVYQFSENFVLPLSHDEVVHGKGSLLGKMPGDDWQKFANLRLLLANMWANPGKKLLFMGGEFGQWDEWNHDESLHWELVDHDRHAGIQKLVADLNALYRAEPALHERDFEPAGFEWIDAGDSERSVLSFLRASEQEAVACVFNLTPIVREDYRIGVPDSDAWEVVLDTDADKYGGSGVLVDEELEVEEVAANGRDLSICVTLPPLGALFLAGRQSKSVT